MPVITNQYDKGSNRGTYVVPRKHKEAWEAFTKEAMNELRHGG